MITHAAAAATAVVLAATAMQRVQTAPTAGWGTGEISGFTVSDVHYSLGAPDRISGVSFQLDAAAKTVNVRLTAADVGRPCAVSGRKVSCTFPGREVPLRALQALAVTAVS